MCRGFQPSERYRDRLKIKAFYIKLSLFSSKISLNLPDVLTLHYLPRINGSQLEINGSTIRPDSPAFVTLHRIVSEEIGSKGIFYGCLDRVTVCEGVRFEVYVGDFKVLKGIFRKDIDEGENWNMGCKCDDVVEGLRYAEVSVAAEGPGKEVVSEKVEMVAEGRRRRRKCCVLEEIPEEREEGELGSDVCGCSECCGEEGMDGGDEETEVEVETEGVRWAVDVGFWVVCIGVGYLVSKASYSRKLRKKILM